MVEYNKEIYQKEKKPLDYDNNSLTYSSGEFTKEDKKIAIKAFSRLHSASLWYLFIATAVIYIIQVILLLTLSENQLTALINSPYYVWGMQVLSMYVIAFPLFMLMISKLPKAEREKSNISFKEFVYIFLASEAIMLAGSLFSEWVIGMFESMLGFEVPNATSDMILNAPIWLVILVAVVIGPIVEEMIFRKAYIDRLSIYGDRLAVVVSAVAFGLFHCNFYQLFYATALGLVLGYVYTKTRRSIYNCLLHMAINFMGTMPSLLLSDSIDRLNALDEDAILEGQHLIDALLVMGVSGLIYLFALAGAIIFIVATLKRAYRFSNECDIKMPFYRLPRVVLFNVGTLVFLIYCLLECFLSLFITA